MERSPSRTVLRERLIEQKAGQSGRFHAKPGALEAILGFCIIYVIYNLAMAPLKGLQRLGMLMFRWAAGIAVAMSPAEMGITMKNLLDGKR